LIIHSVSRRQKVCYHDIRSHQHQIIKTREYVSLHHANFRRIGSTPFLMSL
jgi:hypothetical protein